MVRFALGRASALALLAALGSASLASAQDRPNSSNVFMDEVITTARKTADVETVQDVPISVTAVNSDTFDALKVRDLEQLAFVAPNVTLDDVGTTRGVANFAIRGLGVNSSIPSIDPTVGVFQDGVYFGINGGLVFDLFDIESVEILRGPQGILFGRNTTGGAVLINTTQPTDDFRYKFRTAVESPLDGDRGGPSTYIMGTVTGPIIKDKLNGKIAGYYNKDEGYFKNLFDGSNQGRAETKVLRAGLEWMATPDLTVNVNGQYFKSEGDGPAAQNRGVYDRDSFDFSIDDRGFYDSESYNGVIRADLDVGFGDGRITNIFGYRTSDSDTRGDIDATPFDVFHSDAVTEQEQISNELRYNGNFGNAKVTTGLYYFQQDLKYDEVRELFKFAGPGAPPTFYGGGQQDHEVFGAFINVDYSLRENLILTAGLRYSDESKDASVTFIQPRPPCSVVDGTCPFTGVNPFTGAPDGFVDDNSWSNWSPKVGLQYFIQDDWQAYASYTKGFRSGGYNFRITDVPVFLQGLAANNGEPSFDEEEVDAFEVGTKWTSADRRVNVNAAAYFTDVTDMQRELNLPSAAGVSQVILNTADAEVSGFELDGRVTLVDWLTVTASVGVIDAKYTDVRSDISFAGQPGEVFGTIDQADLDLAIPRVPKATYGVGGILDIPTGERGTVTLRGNFQHRDRFAYTDNNLGWVQSLDRVDASIGYAIENDKGQRISLTAFGRNLLDEVQVGGDTQLPASFGAPYGGYPRATGNAVPFADNPAAGTFSPLKKGKVFGIELTIEG